MKRAKRSINLDSKFARNKPLPFVNNVKNPEPVGKITASQFLVMGDQQTHKKFLDHGKNLKPIIDQAKEEEIKLYEFGEAAAKKQTPKQDVVTPENTNTTNPIDEIDENTIGQEDLYIDPNAV